MARIKMTGRIWFFVIIVTLSFMSIFVTFSPFGVTFLQKGVYIASVNTESPLYLDGLRNDMQVTRVNGNAIGSVEDFERAMDPYRSLTGNDSEKLVITTGDVEVIGLYNASVLEMIRVRNADVTKIHTGLDLRGGARAFVEPSVPIDDGEAEDLIAVLEQRLNVYGLSDINIYRVQDAQGGNLIGVEIAGSSPEELEKLIGEQGHFEAKIGNDTVFVGGDEDVTYVGKSGQDALISECFTATDGSGAEACNFQFVVRLSTKAAERFAEITENLSTENGCIARYDPNCYLEKQIDFYIDGVLTSSLNIGADLRGNAATQIQISGSGSGQSREEAIENAEIEMKRLQTILITGSLPYDLEIVKIDRISPNLGKDFTQQILMGGLFAILAVSVFTFIIYRKIKLSFIIVVISMAEVLMILGVAAMIQWNLDLPSIAGIIAAIGTGIDSQIIILDESRDKNQSLRERIKKALFIITTAFSTTLVALLPLTGSLGFLGIGAASAGLLKGFAITTLIGITVGVFISRPAFADIIKQIEE